MTRIPNFSILHGNFFLLSAIRYAYGAMSLMDAPEYDPSRERRRRMKIMLVVVIVLALATLAFVFRNWREEHVVDKFFTALQQKNYEQAYAIWMADSDWKQHPDKYVRYPYNDFYADWGPGGEWGLVSNHSIDCSMSPKNSSGVIVQVTVNGRAKHPYLWVETSDKSLSFSPQEIRCRGE